MPHIDGEIFSNILTFAERVLEGKGNQSEVIALLPLLSQKQNSQITTAEENAIAGIAFAAAHPPTFPNFPPAFMWLASGIAWFADPTASVDPDDWGSPHDQKWVEAFSSEAAWQAGTLREIVCNPFRPITLNPSWLTSTVLALAQGSYDEKAFDRMPILADALQDAGCDNEDILIHCRQPSEHVRGCWVVDLLLARQ